MLAMKFYQNCLEIEWNFLKKSGIWIANCSGDDPDIFKLFYQFLLFSIVPNDSNQVIYINSLFLPNDEMSIKK